LAADLRRQFPSFDFIDVAPHPIFAGLNRTHERMLRMVEMLGCVLVFRRVATSRVATNQAHAKVNPGIAGFHAILADMLGGMREFDLIEMSAFSRHE
jgi:hypothetical protein